MDSTKHEPLLDYIKEERQKGISAQNIKTILIANDWKVEMIDDAFSRLGIDVNKETGYMVDTPSGQDNKSFATENLTIDKIIQKFIPIAGAIFLMVGLGYLIYANAWVHLGMEIRLTLGFFVSLVIIGASFSFSEKMRYFADIGIGSGILLLYATLIYGSRTTDLAVAMIPEMVTLFTAAIFTVAICYFASKRNSKVILILGMIGAYITPFVIGQNDVWVGNISLNAYLMYFFAINLSVFLLGKEISVREIIPLNVAGLFIGVSTLWHLALTDGINTTNPGSFLTGEIFTSILFLALTVFTIWSILLSAKRFSAKDDGYLSLGYIAPILWFAFNVNNLTSLGDVVTGIEYVIISASCFLGWHYLAGTETRFQHTALYAGGLISAFLAVFTLLEEFNIYTSMLLAYSSLIFAFLYITDSAKSERFNSYIIVSLVGSVLSMSHILDSDLPYETLLIVLALLPAIGAYFIARAGGKPELLSSSAVYSVFWSIVALMFVLVDLLDYIEVNFMLFYLIPLLFLIYMASPINGMTHDSKSRLLPLVMSWFAFGFLTVFFTLFVSIYPAPTNIYIFTDLGYPTDWILVKGIFATIILFVGLHISRKLQEEQVIKRPSFILVIFGFTTLLLTGNYIISALANDFAVSLEHGGPRAIATTIWWTVIAIYMLYVGIKAGKKYHSEKLLGLLLLGITLGKVILYDIATMDMQNKIIVLMVVGGAMMLFSYRVRSQGLLKD